MSQIPVFNVCSDLFLIFFVMTFEMHVVESVLVKYPLRIKLASLNKNEELTINECIILNFTFPMNGLPSMCDDRVSSPFNFFFQYFNTYYDYMCV